MMTFKHIVTGILALLFIGQSVYAKTVYKSQDSQGRTLYTDQPDAEGEKIIIQTPKPSTPNDSVAPTIEQKPLPVIDTDPEKSTQVTSYQMVMLQPKNETVFTHEVEEISVKLFIEPNLHPDDRIQIKVNDEILGGFRQTPEFNLPKLNRGQYDIEAMIVDKSGKGKPKGQTDKIRIYQIRQTIKAP